MAGRPARECKTVATPEVDLRPEASTREELSRQRIPPWNRWPLALLATVGSSAHAQEGSGGSWIEARVNGPCSGAQRARPAPARLDGSLPGGAVPGTDGGPGLRDWRGHLPRRHEIGLGRPNRAGCWTGAPSGRSGRWEHPGSSSLSTSATASTPWSGSRRRPQDCRLRKRGPTGKPVISSAGPHHARVSPLRCVFPCVFRLPVLIDPYSGKDQSFSSPGPRATTTVAIAMACG